MPDESRLDRLKSGLRTAAAELHGLLGARGVAEIAPYRGFAAGRRAYVHGRVLAREAIAASDAGDSAWRNLVATIKRLDSRPVGHAELRVSCGGGQTAVRADDEGFFSAWVDLPEPLTPGRWHPARIDLLAPLSGSGAPPTALARVLAPAETARFVVVSDLDDTVVQSHVTSFLQAVRTMALTNARTRLPFPGVAAFYQALSRGDAGDSSGTGLGNPVFYVSSGPWNLHDVIAEFLELQGLPEGPLLLRDWDLERGALSGGGHLEHKGRLIRELMATYPSLPFILVGDSGQHDPEVYERVVCEAPDRVLAVYIRNVTPGADRRAAIERLAGEVKAAGSTLLLADDTLAAARHAAERGWIRADSLGGIGDEKRADEGAPSEVAPKPDAPGTDAGSSPTVVVE